MLPSSFTDSAYLRLLRENPNAAYFTDVFAAPFGRSSKLNIEWSSRVEQYGAVARAERHGRMPEAFCRCGRNSDARGRRRRAEPVKRIPIESGGAGGSDDRRGRTTGDAGTVSAVSRSQGEAPGPRALGMSEGKGSGREESITSVKHTGVSGGRAGATDCGATLTRLALLCGAVAALRRLRWPRKKRSTVDGTKTPEVELPPRPESIPRVQGTAVLLIVSAPSTNLGTSYPACCGIPASWRTRGELGNRLHSPMEGKGHDTGTFE